MLSLGELREEWSGKPRQVERPIVPSAMPDLEIMPYLNNFISDVRSMESLPKSDLSTPEGARMAVHMLSEKLNELERYRKTALALKSLLLSKCQGEETWQ